MVGAGTDSPVSINYSTPHLPSPHFPSFDLLSLAFLAISYLYLPKSIILHTGGVAFCAISTRSRFAFEACSSASRIFTTPSCDPSLPINLTLCALIRSLIRIKSDLSDFFRCGRGLIALISSLCPTFQSKTQL